MILTLLILVGLTLRVARFGERITIRIISPAPTDPPQVVHPGDTIRVEAIVDAGNAIYKAVDQIGLGMRYDAAIARASSSWAFNPTLVTNHDPVSKRFTHDVRVMRRPREYLLSIDVAVIDRAGRLYNSDRQPPAPGNRVLLRVEPGR
jgi:hypothetical protein